MKPILTLILLTTFCFTLTSESQAQPPWKEQMKRQQEFERERAKRCQEIEREQRKRGEEIFRERSKAQAEFERESFKNYAEQQREAAKWQSEQQREQLKAWEEQQRFYAEQQREQFQSQREFEREFQNDRRYFQRGFPQGQPFGATGFDEGYGFQQPVPGVYQPLPAGPRGQGFAQPPLGHQNGRGQVIQYGQPGMGQIPVQVPGEIIVNPPVNQPFQQGPVISEGPVLNAPGEPAPNGFFGTSVLQPAAIPPYQTQGPAVPPINYGPFQR